MDELDTIKHVIDTHRIRADSTRWEICCAGCEWSGWDHREHLAVTIHTALLALRQQ